MDNASPDSGQPRKNRLPSDDRIVDFVLDDTNSILAKPPYAPLSPTAQKQVDEWRARYRAWEAEYEEIQRQEREDAEKPHPDPNADSSAPGPTSGS
jgi:hypothetical protein